MTTTINASPSNGLVSTADGSGILKVQSNGVTTNATAWVNFNGVTTATIRASYNVSSVTRTALGTYTVNFANAMPDTNYVISGCASRAGTSGLNGAGVTVTDNSVNTARTTTAVQIILLANAGDGAYDTTVDSTWVGLTVFGN